MKVNFWVDAEDEVIELDDDATEEDILEEFDNWLNGSISFGWCIEED